MASTIMTKGERHMKKSINDHFQRIQAQVERVGRAENAFLRLRGAKKIILASLSIGYGEKSRPQESPEWIKFARRLERAKSRFLEQNSEFERLVEGLDEFLLKFKGESPDSTNGQETK